MICGSRLADGQWWGYCGQTDMGQTVAVQCIKCEPKYGYLLKGASREEIEEQNKKREMAFQKYKEAGFAGDLKDYL